MVAEGSEALSHPWLRSECEPSLGYIRACLKRKRKKKEGKKNAYVNIQTAVDVHSCMHTETCLHKQQNAASETETRGGKGNDSEVLLRTTFFKALILELCTVNLKITGCVCIHIRIISNTVTNLPLSCCQTHENEHTKYSMYTVPFHPRLTTSCRRRPPSWRHLSCVLLSIHQIYPSLMKSHMCQFLSLRSELQTRFMISESAWAKQVLRHMPSGFHLLRSGYKMMS